MPDMDVLIDKLKFNLREESSPFFDEQELMYLLEDNRYDIRKATYQGLVIKSEDDSIALPGGLQVPSNRNYWLGLAKKYRQSSTGVLGRADGC